MDDAAQRLRVVPAYRRRLTVEPVRQVGDRQALIDLVAAGGIVVLSGAGLSTGSGIPDYRGPSGALRRHAPMTFQEFMNDPAGRRRYWARSYIGWPRIAQARPNAGHRAVAALERSGLVSATITQNVDGLHQSAGARFVVDLHGRLDRVVCLTCGATSGRVEHGHRLERANPGFAGAVAAVTRSAPIGDGAVNPDGDVALPEDLVASFTTVECTSCGADALKPDVVFFGEGVPAPRVSRAKNLVDRARGLLVLGSSLTVMSGYRFVLQACARGVPVAIVNSGPTRGDGNAAVRLEEELGEVLTDLSRRVAGG